MKTFFLISTILVIIAMVAKIILVIIIKSKPVRQKKIEIILILSGVLAISGNIINMSSGFNHVFSSVPITLVTFYLLILLILIFFDVAEYIKIKRDPRIIWKRIYKEWFGLEKDFSNLEIPKEYNPKKYFAVILIQEISMNEVVVAMRKRFDVNLYVKDLDREVTQNNRTAEEGDYVILFNRNIEADEKFKNLSADQLKEVGHNGITLMERLLLEVLYFNETQRCLDVENVTICSGSRYSTGRVPSVGGGLSVGSLRSDYFFGDLRSREVVFPNS